MHLTGVGYTRYDLMLDAPQGTSLVLHQFYYPGWQASWQGDTVRARPQSTLGLATFDLAPGSGQLTLRLAFTPAQIWGTVASLVTLSTRRDPVTASASLRSSSPSPQTGPTAWMTCLQGIAPPLV